MHCSKPNVMLRCTIRKRPIVPEPGQSREESLEMQHIRDIGIQQAGRQLIAALGNEMRGVAPLLGQLAAWVVGLVLVFGTVTLVAAGLLQASLQLQVGDVWRLGPDLASPALPGMTVRAVVVSSAGLAPGSECVLGIGREAEAAGTLIILRRDPAGAYRAAWASPGRSARRGQDCGRTAELELSGRDVRDARLGSLVGPIVGATGT